TSESVWALANASSHLFDKLSAFVKPRAMYGSLNFTDAIGVDLRMRLDTEDEAKQLVSVGKAQPAATKTYVDRFDVTSEGSDGHVAVGIPVAHSKEIRDQFGGMLPSVGTP